MFAYSQVAASPSALLEFTLAGLVCRFSRSFANVSRRPWVHCWATVGAFLPGVGQRGENLMSDVRDVLGHTADVGVLGRESNLASVRLSLQCDPKRSIPLTTTLITKLFTNPLAKSRSRADARDQSPGSGLVHHTGRLSMAWKRSGVSNPLSSIILETLFY